MTDPLDLLLPELPALLDRPIDEQFPGLRPGSARLDGPGGTLVHGAVATAVARYLAGDLVANDHGAFPASRFSDALVAWSVHQIRALLGGGEDHAVVFGPNMTTLTGMATRAVGAALGPGDESSAPSWTTRPTSARGRRWPASGARRSGWRPWRRTGCCPPTPCSTGSPSGPAGWR